MQSAAQVLSGWGNLPVQNCHLARPETLDMLGRTIVAGDMDNYISRGLGRSYGDAALNKGRGVILQTRLNRFLSFDDRRGVIQCEGGVSLAEIVKYMLPRGWMLPTTPGTKHVTVGGAIASDVHGKNHHRDGSFGNYVQSLELMVASGEVLHCSPTENDRLFWATVGGMGLTGAIVSARVQLKRTESAFVKVTYQRTANLAETLDAFAATDKDFKYSVAWVDCLAANRSLGRSVVMLANDAKRDELGPSERQRPLELPASRTRSVPVNLPSFALNRWSVKAFNWLYYTRHKSCQRLVDHNSFFYPLDGVRHWNRAYGRRGFVQYQALFPSNTSRQALAELLYKISASKQASFLAVLKSCGPASKGMLSFLYPGHTLALDFPYRGERTRQLVQELDDVVIRHGGRLYLAKDAMMSAETFRKMYPRLAEFQTIKADIDPHSRFVSSQAIRLGIVADPAATKATDGRRAA